MTIKHTTLKSIAIAVSLSCGAFNFSAIAHDTPSHANTPSTNSLAKVVAG